MALVKQRKRKGYSRLFRYIFWGVLFILFMAFSVIFYAYKLNHTFQENAIIYANEIARQASYAVDSEIENQWESLEQTVNHIQISDFTKLTKFQDYLKREEENDHFQRLVFVTKDGISFTSRSDTNSVLDAEWSEALLTKRKPVALLASEEYFEQSGDQFLVIGIPIEPFEIEGKEFVAALNVYKLKPILNKLDISIFAGQGMAHLLQQNGMAISIHSNSVFQPFNQDNLFNVLRTKAEFKHGYSLDDMIEKANENQVSGAVVEINGKDIILSMYHVDTLNWYLMISSMETVTSEQTNHFLKLTLLLLTVIALIIGILIAFVIWNKRKHTQDKLYREQLFRLISIHVNEVFVIYNASNHEFEYVSDNIERVLGITKEEYIKTKGMIITRMIKKEERDDYHREMFRAKQAVFEGKVNIEPLRNLFSWKHKQNEEQMWISMASYVTLTELNGWKQQRYIKTILVYSDWTMLKKRESELEQAVMVAQASEAAAIKVEKSKTMFFSNVSHEIRTPLNGIVGLIDLMEKSIADPAQLKDYLKKMEFSTKYLLSLINDILDMAKLENGNLKLRSHVFNLFDVMNEMETIFYYQCLEKGIRFTIISECIQCYYFYSDMLRIQQIIINLLSNAVKFTEEDGTITLKIEQEELDKDRVLTRFSVQDTGCGMSDEFLKRIGNPFEQEHLQENTRCVGTGLGLAISKQFVQLMGGTFSVESKLSKGSIFVVELPLQKAKPETDEPEEAIVVEPENIEGMKLLLAEDNDLNMEILTTVLEAEGVLCSSAKNGEMAVELFASSEPGFFDAVIMDLQMPVMDGYRASDKIREMNRYDAKTVPIIACTANMLTDEIEEIEAHQMNGFFTKPISNSDLLQFLYKIKK